MPWALIVAACLGSFAATSSGTTRAPFLLDMARDFDVPMPLVANLVSLTATAWGLVSAMSGWLSDRIGRRALLIGALLALALVMALQALSANFAILALWATVSGAVAGVYTSQAFSEVAARVADRQRGRALGWVMSGQSLTLVVGVPMAAAVGALIGWRGWMICVGGLAAAASVALFFSVPRTEARPVGAARTSMRGALTPRVLGPLAAIAVPLAVFAFGNVVGTIVGGQLADRLRDRLLTFAVGTLASGAVAMGLFLWHPNPIVSVALGFLYVFTNALGRPSLMASYAEVPEQVRGTVMGLTGTAASVGWIGAAALGGAIIGAGGFDGFGPLALVLSLLGALGAMWCRKQISI
ncbi:MAG: MFS transporter [Alphaproteobacteria bacterium]|nr:MFS transporter [Alphaproteobacteria bacterium]